MWFPDGWQKDPSVETRERDHIIPVWLKWAGGEFKAGKGGCLTKKCLDSILDWLDVFEVEETALVEEKEARGFLLCLCVLVLHHYQSLGMVPSGTKRTSDLVSGGTAGEIKEGIGAGTPGAATSSRRKFSTGRRR